MGGSGAGISSPRHDACVRREVEGNEGSERGGVSGGLVPDPDWIGRGGTAWGGVRVVGLGFPRVGGYGRPVGPGRSWAGWPSWPGAFHFF